jgi:O-acetyl-ADP-ribose deacetylase (regulator of RNase III)
VPEVFVNYRVRDQAGYAALLDRELSRRFGADAVFLAPRSISPGDDFERAILGGLRTCRVMLVVIGPQWLAEGVPADRGAEPDWVHREIVEALALGLRVIPVLVEDADMPAEAVLPADLTALTRCQFLRLHHGTIENDMNRVVGVLDRVLNGPAPAHSGGGPLARPVLPAGSPCRIGVLPGSIRRVRCADVWVNPENTDMEMSRVTDFSISGIVRYEGAERDGSGRVTADLIADELAAAVGDRRPVAPGAAIVTGPGALATSHRVRYVIHVAAVQGEPGAGFRQVRDVGRCVTGALAAAERLGGDDEPVRSILFPLLGAGEGGGRLAPTVRALLDATVDHLAETPDTRLRTIWFLGFTEAERAALENAIRHDPRLAWPPSGG